ncbi:aromatic acid exporter family protein [Nesterenkonia halotolerans]|uniref:FUSC family protein n=1 Tax=Nesterenkonia halotolerans TaxID=225325 RepID=UPI003EE75A6E
MAQSSTDDAMNPHEQDQREMDQREMDQREMDQRERDAENSSQRAPSLREPTNWLTELGRRPEFLTDVLQILKTVIAGTLAWWISTSVLDSELAFLAPWTALLTVHATVHRSLSHGIQTTIASTIGVGLSFVIGYFLGVSLWTFALALLVGVTAARISWIRDEGVAIATTAIFVLGSGFDDQAPLLNDRILEVAIGVAAGVLVNLLILPPLRDKQAGRYVDSINERMGSVLVSISREFSDSWDTDKAESWFQETESMTQELNSAWTVVRFARESRRANPRARQGRPSLEHSSWNAQEASYEEILERADEGISHLRHLTRTLREATYSDGDWDDDFRDRWARIVGDVGRAIADPDAEVASLHEDLTSLSTEMSEDKGLPKTSWPIYGSLISSLRHLVIVVDDVASARQAREGGEENPKVSG